MKLPEDVSATRLLYAPVARLDEQQLGVDDQDAIAGFEPDQSARVHSRRQQSACQTSLQSLVIFMILVTTALAVLLLIALSAVVLAACTPVFLFGVLRCRVRAARSTPGPPSASDTAHQRPSRTGTTGLGVP